MSLAVASTPLFKSPKKETNRWRENSCNFCCQNQYATKYGAKTVGSLVSVFFQSAYPKFSDIPKHFWRVSGILPAASGRHISGNIRPTYFRQHPAGTLRRHPACLAHRIVDGNNMWMASDCNMRTATWDYLRVTLGPAKAKKNNGRCALVCGVVWCVVWWGFLCGEWCKCWYGALCFAVWRFGEACGVVGAVVYVVVGALW